MPGSEAGAAIERARSGQGRNEASVSIARCGVHRRRGVHGVLHRVHREAERGGSPASASERRNAGTHRTGWCARPAAAPDRCRHEFSLIPISIDRNDSGQVSCAFSLTGR